jgi:hypothetical protein
LGDIVTEEAPVAAVDAAPQAMACEAPVGSQPIPAKPRRFLPLAALAVVAVLAAVGALLWVDYTHTPQYSLGQMARAAQNKDWDGVQKYVDVDAVASAFVDVAISKAFGEDTSGASALGAGMKPTAIRQFKDSLKNSVENATSTKTAGLSGVLFVTKPSSVTYVSNEEALVTVEVPSFGDQSVRLRMTWADDHWRITAFESAADLTSQYE